MRVEVSTAPLGLRERNKLDKLRRIKAASRELFVAKGFDDTTVREIATRADVGMGTVFLYADNKRDLLFLIANDELEAITQKAIVGFRPDGAVPTNLMRAFRPHYEFFGQQPELSRFKLREMMFYDTGKQAKRFQTIRERLVGLLTSIIAAGQQRGTIKHNENAAFIAWIAFCIYQVELRSWLASDSPDLQSGLKRLEKALKLLLSGAAPSNSSNSSNSHRRHRR